MNDESQKNILLSSKFDLLAKQVLKTSHILPLLPRQWFDNNNNNSSNNNGGENEEYKESLCHVVALERVLDINENDNVRCTSLSNNNINNDDNDDTNKESGTLLTCTDFQTSPFFHHNHNNNTISNNIDMDIDDSNHNNNNKPQYWTPPIIDDNSNITQSYNNNDSTNDNESYDYPSLEEMAPFSNKFYISVGQLLSFMYSQSSISITNQNNNHHHLLRQNNNNNSDDSHDKNDNLTNLQLYSIEKHVYNVRVTKILSALMELNVIGSKSSNPGMDDSLKEDDDDDDDDEEVSFLDLLLYHNEQNSLLLDTITKQERRRRSKNPSHSNHVHHVPFIQSLFKYYGTLPQLESHIYTIVRIYRSISSKDNMAAKVEHMKITERLQDRLENELQTHLSSLEYIIGTIYIKCDVELRKKIRLRIGNFLHSFALRGSSSSGSGSSLIGMGVENTSAAGVDSMLKILLRILQGITTRNHSGLGEEGMSTPKLQDAHRHLLLHILLPLHKPSGMVLWRDQKPIIGLYHKSLVQCIGCIVSFDTSLISKVIQYLLHPDVWPLEGGSGGKKGSNMANTPKVVLLLHEIDTLINLLKVASEPLGDESETEKFDTLKDSIVPLVLRLSSCISSDNSRTSERALEFFKNNKFNCLVKLHIHRLMTPLLRALCRVDSGMEIPWNPTVRKMTLLVLQKLESYDKPQFSSSCVEVLSKKQIPFKDKAEEEQMTGSVQTKSLNEEGPTADMISLRKSMGSWKPPTKHSMTNNMTSSNIMPPPKARKSGSMGNNSTPPLTVTGVAPWSIKHNASQNQIGAQPPLTVTGVAPWSIRPVPSGVNAKSSLGSSRSKNIIMPLPPAKSNQHTAANPMPNTNDVPMMKISERSISQDAEASSVAKIGAFIDELKTSASNGEENDNVDGISNWAKSQMAESPLLLPSLKFHDLVFGQILGTGSFSTVKYARQIIKGKTRSYWPEFAVKVVSTQRIEELGYETSINREIAILRMLSHPGIARLVSSFRFREGAYLILEYASRGDLYNLLKQNGSLDEESSRFVTGELVSALYSIHELGLVYVDLKPENILITESGHVKITDFGGCRAITANAKESLKNTGQNLLKTLRDGDWRDAQHVSKENKDDDDEILMKQNHSINDDNNDDFKDDIRVEGTTAYLPPEVILGGYPSFSTDSWALGCVLYQCLAGRPPLLGENDLSTKQRIVSFAGEETNSGGMGDDLFSVDGIDDRKVFSNHSKSLIKQLLSLNPRDRPSMSMVSEHSFFDGVDVFTLYKQSSCRLDAGRIAPKPDAAWTRRQFSSIWAPQPQAYNISSGVGDDTKGSNGKQSTGAIPEGNECQGFFLVSSLQNNNKRPLLVGISERDD